MITHKINEGGESFTTRLLSLIKSNFPFIKRPKTYEVNKDGESLSVRLLENEDRTEVEMIYACPDGEQTSVHSYGLRVSSTVNTSSPRDCYGQEYLVGSISAYGTLGLELLDKLPEELSQHVRAPIKQLSRICNYPHTQRRLS